MDIKPYIDKLDKANIFAPGPELKILFDHVFGKKFDNLPKTIEDLPEDVKKKLDALVERRVQHISSIRLCGSASFCDLDITVKDGVFAPCPETSMLVDHGVILLQNETAPVRILDMGTGSGCILLGLLHALPHATGMGIDCNEKAVDLANKNARKLGLQDRAAFRISDWGREISEKFDLIVSNPPRVAMKNIPYLMPEMKDHDPLESLDGGKDGLDFFRRTANDFERLAKDGRMGLFQTGPTRAKTVGKIFAARGFADQKIKRDYLGLPFSLLVRNIKTPVSLWTRLWSVL